MAKKKADPRGGHIRLYNDIFDSVAWRVLDYSAMALWLAMRRQLKATNNGDIEATLGTLKHSGFTSPATLSKGLRSLQAVGLIAITRKGGIAYGNKVCSLYRFTDESTYPNEKIGLKFALPTNEWQRFNNMAQALATLAESHAATRLPIAEPELQNKSGLQILKRIDTESVAQMAVSDTEIEEDDASTASNIEHVDSS